MINKVRSNKLLFDKLNEYINSASELGVSRNTLSKIKTVAGASLLADLLSEKKKEEKKESSTGTIIITVLAVIAFVAVAAAVCYAVISFIRRAGISAEAEADTEYDSDAEGPKGTESVIIDGTKKADDPDSDFVDESNN